MRWFYGEKKRAESRCRYLVREIAQQKGWNTKHPQNGGDFLEEQEIEDFFPDSGLEKTKPDFLLCKNYNPMIVVEAKNEIKKIDIAICFLEVMVKVILRMPAVLIKVV